MLNLYKQAYKGLSKDSWYLAVVMLINRAGTMVVPFLSIYCIRELHFSIVQAGTIMALFGTGAITGVFTGGKITDKLGFYDVQVGALFTGGIFFILLGFQHQFIHVAIGTFILSFCNEAFRPANSTAIAHYSVAENRTRSYSLNRLATNLGWAVGGGLGGLLASVNYHLLFWVDGCTNIFAAVLLLRLLTRVKKQKGEVTQEIKAIAGSAYRDKVFLVFMALSTIFSCCFFEFFIMQPVFYKLEWHIGERMIGFLLALNGLLIVAVEMVMVHKLEGKRHVLIYIMGGILVCAAGFAVMNIFPAGLGTALLVVILITFGEMLSMPFMNTYWITRSNEHNRGEYAAVYSMSWSAAQIIAPWVGSRIIDVGGFSSLWWIMTGASLFTFAGYLVIYKLNTAISS